MTVREYPIDPPVTGLWCRNCNDPIVATATVHDGKLTFAGLREYRWTHQHGTDQCLPKTVAQPFDGWQATSHVEAALEARYDPEAVL